MPRKTATTSSVKTASPAVRSTRTTHRKPVAEASVVEEVKTSSASSEDISRLAYALWEQRGCPAGSPEEDWLRAEEMLIK